MTQQNDAQQQDSDDSLLTPLTVNERLKLLTQLKADYKKLLAGAPVNDDVTDDKKTAIKYFEDEKAKLREKGEDDTSMDQMMRDRLADQSQLFGRDIVHRLVWEAERLDGEKRPYMTRGQQETFGLSEDDFSKIYKYADPSSREATHSYDAKRRALREAALYDVKALDIIHQRITNKEPIEDYTSKTFINGKSKYGAIDTYEQRFEEALKHGNQPRGASAPSLAEEILSTPQKQQISDKLNDIQEDLQYWQAYKRFDRLKKEVDEINQLHHAGKPSREESNLRNRIEIYRDEPTRWISLIEEDLDNDAPEMKKYGFDKGDKGKPLDYRKEIEAMRKAWKTFTNQNDVGMDNTPSDPAMRDALRKYTAGHKHETGHDPNMLPLAGNHVASIKQSFHKI